MGEKLTQAEQLIKALEKLRVSDWIGLGKLVGIEDAGNFGVFKNFEDFAVEIVWNFSQRNREERRKLLKLIEKVGKANKDLGLLDKDQS